jgi:hypothetical protein
MPGTSPSPGEALSCPSFVVYDNLVYRCGRDGNHERSTTVERPEAHEAVGQNPQDGENYLMRWTTPTRVR